VRAVILAGGKGSRLRPFTFSIPKPLVPIGDVPIVEILLRQLKRQGFSKVTMSVGYLASLIRAYCGDGARWDLSIEYLEESEPLGTIGCLAILDDLDDADRVLLINGDTLTDMSFSDAFAAHHDGDAITLCANRRSVRVDFGVLDVGDQGYLAAYTEKPTLNYRVSMGVNVVSAWAIGKFLRRGEAIDVPEFVERAREAGAGVRVLDVDAYWLDLGRLQDLEKGDALLRAHRERFLPA